MPEFTVEFQINERGVVSVFATDRDAAEEKVREMLSTGEYLKYVQRSDSFVEAM